MQPPQHIGFLRQLLSSALSLACSMALERRDPSVPLSLCLAMDADKGPDSSLGRRPMSVRASVAALPCTRRSAKLKQKLHSKVQTTVVGRSGRILIAARLY